jgi:hypothetical protein
MYRAGDLGHLTAVDNGACSNLGGSLSQAKVLAAATPEAEFCLCVRIALMEGVVGDYLQ